MDSQSVTRADQKKLKRKVSEMDLQTLKLKNKDGKRALMRLSRQKNGQLDSLMRDLLILEAHLLREQNKIVGVLAYKDKTICEQQNEIEKLRRDNRRLILRIKKLTQGTKKEEERNPSQEEHSSGLFESERVEEMGGVSLLTSQFYEKTALHYTDKNGQVMEKVLHKPPISKKPKLNQNLGTQLGKLSAIYRPIAAMVKSNGQSNIVSTISRLLEEESDQGLAESSSEPSSPDATLKPSTSGDSKVFKLAQQYEKGFLGNGHPVPDHSSKTMMILDEHEVTSGYNSDSISDQDPDYENVVVLREKATEEPKDVHQPTLDSDEESNQNYDNCNRMKNVLNNLENVIYGNENDVEHSRGISSDSSQEYNGCEIATSDGSIKNIPRSRHNINLIIDSDTGKGAQLMDNFEEFSLDSLNLDDDNGETYLTADRHSGDGAESKNIPHIKERADSKSYQNGPSVYEKFLEVTGLSQKSILTPSRIFSNHRSVLKPRDIKHRDKLRSVFTTLSTVEEVAPQTYTNQKHWTGPYL